jgi:DNA-binding NtrC family response regulator
LARERILIVDDEELIRWSLKERLSQEGYLIDEAGTGAEARDRLAAEEPDLVLLDMRLPDAGGLELLAEIQKLYPEAMIILMTAYSSVQDAVQAIKHGAYDYVNKPFELEALALAVAKALETTALRREVRRSREKNKHRFGFSSIVGATRPMQRVFDLVRRVARSEASTVLLTGESGTGKDLVAKAIHYQSNRADKPFLNVTCTAIAETLLESELFGHERGAFTDARTQKKGLFELAHRGTVFLDEIGDMPASLQSKLLRFLQEKRFRRVGGTVDLEVDVRIIAATNRDLKKLVDEGQFREDLFYRLNVIPITLPSLRERLPDVQLLAGHFVDEFNHEFKKEVRGLTPAALEVLVAYSWPGNVRELRNVIERAMILGTRPEIDVDDLPFELSPGAEARSSGNGGNGKGGFTLPPQGVNIEGVERSLLVQALRRCRGNKTRASRLLGLNRDQVRYRIDKFGLTEDDYLPGTEPPPE